MIFPCGMCNFLFPSKYTLHMHFRDDHKIDKTRGEKMFQCPYCEKKCSRNTNLKMHVRTFHKEAAPALIICPSCKSSFETLRAAKEHERKVHKESKSEGDRLQKRVSCSECQEQFSDRSTMYRHFRRKHKNVELKTHLIPTLPCPECPQFFARHTEQQTHLTTVHGIEISSKMLRFSSLREFETWKAQEEAYSVTNFAKRTSNKHSSYYLCTMSSKGRKRSGMGIEKYTTTTVKCCPARIILKKEGKEYFATFFNTHVGHPDSIDSFNITSEERSRLLAE